MSEAAAITANSPATSLPRPGAGAANADEPQTYLAFDMAGQIFAADVQYVREVLDHQPITPLPNASPELLGVIDIRGESVAVIDLSGRLSLGPRESDREGRIIVFMRDREGGTPIGVIAEQVRGVIELGPDEIEAAAERVTGWDDSTVRGIARIGGALAMVLAMERLFGREGCDPFDFS